MRTWLSVLLLNSKFPYSRTINYLLPKTSGNNSFETFPKRLYIVILPHETCCLTTMAYAKSVTLACQSIWIKRKRTIAERLRPPLMRYVIKRVLNHIGFVSISIDVRSVWNEKPIIARNGQHCPYDGWPRRHCNITYSHRRLMFGHLV